MRFERSGNFDPASTGNGGVGLYAPTGSSRVTTFEIADSEWAGNAALSAPALYAFFVRAAFHYCLAESLLTRQCHRHQADYFVRMRRCMFRENTAYSYGGALAALGPALST